MILPYLGWEFLRDSKPLTNYHQFILIIPIKKLIVHFYILYFLNPKRDINTIGDFFKPRFKETIIKFLIFMN